MPLAPTPRMIVLLGGPNAPQPGTARDVIKDICEIDVPTVQCDSGATTPILLYDIAPRSGVIDLSGKDEGAPVIPRMTVIIRRGASKAALATDFTNLAAAVAASALLPA
jgi:hypothetical protein